MKYTPFIFLLIAMALSACSNGPKSDQTEVSIENTDSIEKQAIEEPQVMEVIDPLQAILDTLTYPVPVYEDLPIYRLHPREIGYRAINGFIPLTDAYPWSEHPDSLAIDDQYLGERGLENSNYHEMNELYRSRFLNNMEISENDWIYVYCFTLDSMLEYRVKEIPLVAMVNPYGAYDRIMPYEYMIGFELNNEDIKGFEYWNCFVNVGPTNPFRRGYARSMDWKKLDSCEDVPSKLSNRDSLLLSQYQLIGCYRFTNENLTYHLRDMASENGLGARHLLVTQAGGNEVLFNKVYYDAESTYPEPLNGIQHTHGDRKFQWTGALFRGKSPVVFGFLSHSFGCASIDFIAEEDLPIQIRCDNRH